MAVSVDWGDTKVIFVPQSFLTFISAGLYELDTDSFRLALKGLEDDAEGMVFLDTHRHNTIVLLGGIGYARTIEIINGYTVEFEDGQYAVNLVGSNNNIADVSVVNQVSVRSNNSAGLIQTREIQQAAFDNAVHIHTAMGTAGTAYPLGTPTDPVNNLDDALIIAGLRGLDTLMVNDTLTIEAGQNIDEFIVQGRGAMLHWSLSQVVVEVGASADNVFWRDVKVDGTQAGESHYRDTTIGVLDDLHCNAHHCALKGPISLKAAVSATHTLSVHDCYSGTAELLLDINGSQLKQDWVNFNGAVRFSNGTHASSIVRVHLVGGTVTLDASCTAGTYIIEGNCDVVDNSTGAASVDTTGVVTAKGDRLLSVGKFLGLK